MSKVAESVSGVAEVTGVPSGVTQFTCRPTPGSSNSGTGTVTGKPNSDTSYPLDYETIFLDDAALTVDVSEQVTIVLPVGRYSGIKVASDQSGDSFALIAS
jgi:hypothetical protein